MTRQTYVRPDKTLLLYPDGQNSEMGIALGPGESNGIAEPESMTEVGNISAVSDQVRVDFYFPQKPDGQMVVICPGGAYRIISSLNEGAYVADWLLGKGITVAVLKYRLPNGHWNVPLTDIQNVLRYSHAHAGEWNVDQIGIMGFSAGGHLAAAACNFADGADTMPDFAVLMYPVITLDPELTHLETRRNLIGGDDKWAQIPDGASMQKSLAFRYSLENQVSEKTPPTFIGACADDPSVPVRNSLVYYNKLLEHHVVSELHIYPHGGHGWGFSKECWIGKGNDPFSYARQDYEASLERWLREIHLTCR